MTTKTNPEADGYVLRFPKIQIGHDGHRILTGSLKAHTGRWTALAFDPATGDMAWRRDVAALLRGTVEVELAAQLLGEPAKAKA